MLNYDVNAQAWRAVLHKILRWAICEIVNEINAGRDKMRVTELETGISKVYLDDDDAARPGYRTFLIGDCLFSITEFCFVIDAVYYKIKVEIFVKIRYTLALILVTPF